MFKTIFSVFEKENLFIIQSMVDAADEGDKEAARELANTMMAEKLPEEQFGSPKAAIGKWASQLRVMDPISGDTKFVYEFEQNESTVW